MSRRHRTNDDGQTESPSEVRRPASPALRRRQTAGRSEERESDRRADSPTSPPAYSAAWSVAAVGWRRLAPCRIRAWRTQLTTSPVIPAGQSRHCCPVLSCSKARAGVRPAVGRTGRPSAMRGSPRVREPRGAQAGREQRAQAPKKKNSRTGLPAAPGMMAAQPRRSGRGHLGQLGRHPSRHRQSTSAKPASPGRQAVGRGTGAPRRPTGRRQGRRRRSPRVPAPPRWDRRPRRRGGAAGPTHRTPDRRQIRSPG